MERFGTTSCAMLASVLIESAVAAWVRQESEACFLKKRGCRW